MLGQKRPFETFERQEHRKTWQDQQRAKYQWTIPPMNHRSTWCGRRERRNKTMAPDAGQTTSRVKTRGEIFHMPKGGGDTATKEKNK